MALRAVGALEAPASSNLQGWSTSCFLTLMIVRIVQEALGIVPSLFGHHEEYFFFEADQEDDRTVVSAKETSANLMVVLVFLARLVQEHEDSCGW